MTSNSHATPPSLRSTRSHRRSGRHGSRERKSHNRRKSAPRDEPVEYVYGAPEEKKRSSRVIVTETRRLGRDKESSEEEEEHATQSDPVKEKRKVKVIYVSAEEATTLKHKERSSRTSRESSERPRRSEESVHRSRSHRSHRGSVSGAPHSPPKRFAILNMGSGKS
jgi:hypothetical protein